MDAPADIVKHEFDFKQSYENVNYQNVDDTDYYRRGNPYKIFYYPQQSNVVIHFSLSKCEVDTVKSVTIALNHCSTSAEGIIDILFNDVKCQSGYLSPKWNFGRESFKFVKDFKEGVNSIEILLSAGSPGVYWLSDAVISMAMKYVRTLKDITGQFIGDNNIPYDESDIPRDLFTFMESKLYIDDR